MTKNKNSRSSSEKQDPTENNLDPSLTHPGVVLVLTSAEDKTLTKIWVQPADGGKPIKRDYDYATMFDPTEEMCDGIDELDALLHDLAKEKHSCVIRGARKAEFSGDELIYRRICGRGDDEPASIEDTPRSWIMFDIDGVEAPPKGGESALNYEELIKYLIKTCLPQPFHNATCSWQWSASAGDPGAGGGVYGWDELRAHLWFWLATPATSRQLKRWAEVVQLHPKVDRGLFNPVQVHYTAAPHFRGMSSPVSTRNGLLRGSTDQVDLVMPKPTIAPSRSGLTKGGRGSSSSRAGDLTPIVPINEDSLLSDEVLKTVRETIYKAWPSEGTGYHQGILALAGGLLRLGWGVEGVSDFISRATPPRESSRPEEIIEAVITTAGRLEDGMEATGWASLSRLIGKEVVSEIRDALDSQDLGGLRCPKRYVINSSGVFVEEEKKEEKKKKEEKEEEKEEEEKETSYVRIVDRPLWISERMQDEAGGVKFVLRCQGRDHIIDRGSAVLKRKMADTLANLDLPVTEQTIPGLTKFLGAFERENLTRFRNLTCTDRCGWHGDRFVLPDVYDDVVVNPPGVGEIRLMKALGVSGELDEVRRAMDMIEDSPQALFVVWASVAAPLLNILKVPNFIVHLWYESSSGKTTVQELGASIWGDPSAQAGLLGTWNSTVVGIEQRAAFLSDLPFFLSEIRTVGGDRDLMRAIYMLAEGQGKSRGARQGGTRAQQSWRSVVISTGESSITACSEYSGIAVRVIELYGNLLSKLNGDQVVELEHIARNNFGIVGRAFIELIRSKPYLLEDLKQDFESERATLAKLLEDKNNFGHRMSFYGAAIVMGAEIFHTLILGDPIASSKIRDVVARVMKSDLDEKQQSYAERALAALDSWVTENTSHFSPNAVATFGKVTREGHVAILPTVLAKACEELSLDYYRVVRDFHERGWLDHEGERRQKTIRLGTTKTKAYVINGLKRSISRHDEERRQY